MFNYPSIPGPSIAHLGEPCVAFHKYDGSNLRFFWNVRRGWHHFSTRYGWFTADTPTFGSAIRLFQEQFAEGILEAVRHGPNGDDVTELVACCEFFGRNTFAGRHREGDAMEMVLFDVYLPERGFLPPDEFLALFGHLRTVEVVYRGPFTAAFIEEVRAGKYRVKEGVVVKGVRPRGEGQEECAVWSAKIKTRAWLDELRRQAGISTTLVQEAEANDREQTLTVDVKAEGMTDG